MESIVTAIIAGGLAMGICKKIIIEKAQNRYIIFCFLKKDIAH